LTNLNLVNNKIDINVDEVSNTLTIMDNKLLKLNEIKNSKWFDDFKNNISSKLKY
jgi:hypothetical protein